MKLQEGIKVFFFFDYYTIKTASATDLHQVNPTPLKLKLGIVQPQEELRVRII
jgi:hypothetical protein